MSLGTPTTNCRNQRLIFCAVDPLRIVFRASAVADLKWFRRYYRAVFREGEKNAKHHYVQTFRLLQEHPLAGRSLGPETPMRELSIPRTPFSFVYYVAVDEIMIIRVLDGRAERLSGVEG